MEVNERYRLWVEKAFSDPDLKRELQEIEGNEKEIEDRFYRELEFGTGGLRGVIGAGTYRMNVYTVGKATQGYSNYLKRTMQKPSVAIAYDSRIKSDVFARAAACVFAANGIQVHLYAELMPTPSLSFAVRHLKCSGGIVITASHNPAKYNGYKVYGSDGCQITVEAAELILDEISKVDVFADVKTTDFEEAVRRGNISYIDDEVINLYLDAVSECALNPKQIDKEVSIVYTPLNGAGRRCVTTCLERNGFHTITIPPEQEMPDGSFPTCPYPNPEIREALEVGLKKAKDVGSDLLLATDPDCDRCGVAVKDGDGFTLISGNQMGVLLFDYICKKHIENGTMPMNPIAVSTIVSTKMVDRLSKTYGVEIRRVLTGFKFIGEQIGFLEQKGEETRYIFGFEESYGYLSGSFVRDKDAVNASLLICEMFAHYKAIGKSLLNVLNELYETYGYYMESLESLTFEGVSGFETMQRIMRDFSTCPPKEIAGRKMVQMVNYNQGIRDLPKSNVLEFNLEGDVTVVIRPSGTEPKLKIYYLVKENSKKACEKLIQAMKLYFADLK